MPLKPPKNRPRSRDSSGERFSHLAAMGEVVFHTGDLANLWNIRNTSTLHVTLSRYVLQGLLFRLQNGLYSIKSPIDLPPYLVGLKVLHGPAYISCETVLFDAGVISQPSRSIAIVSGVSRRFTLAGHDYISRQLADAFLFNDTGVNIKDGARIADLPRAVADILYFNPKKYFDVPTAIPWDAVWDIIRAIGYPTSIMKAYDHTK
ncbi:MAG: hypothetical protein EXS55_04755 [Candidatus Magasanikbacteria bacterium]|nr:hypothetical protein [Candidatus Magasanikbacteria bacterium]